MLDFVGRRSEKAIAVREALNLSTLVQGPVPNAGVTAV